jgi:hypothetical protein
MKSKAVDDSRNAIFNQFFAEVDQQAELQIHQAQVRQDLFL